MNKKIAFIIAYALIGFGAMQVPFSQLIGASDIKFSLFDFYGPIAGAFVGSLWGLIAVGLMQITNWAVNGFSMDMGTIIRMLPVLFAVLYFAKKTTKWTLIVPAIAMILFWAHPEGRLAWYYALYWLIPFIAYPFAQKYTIARALGATFTQHSVGGLLWIWAFNMKATLWIGLIPIVWKERLAMTIGITITYVAFNYVISFILQKMHITIPFLSLNPKFSVENKI